MPPLLGTRNVIFLAITAAFAALALPSASALNSNGQAKVMRACALVRTGNLRLPRRPRCRRGERQVTWDVAGPPGPQGPKGDPGAAGPVGAGHPSIFSAQAAAYVGALSPAF